jgi:hypothetical protein
MPYQFTEYSPEPEPQPASSCGNRLPEKGIGRDPLENSPSELTPTLLRLLLWLGIMLMIGATIILLVLAGRLETR